MTPRELADAMERNAYTLGDGTPCRCQRCEHHRAAARTIRTLHAMLLDTGRSLALLTEAIERVGGAQ